MAEKKKPETNEEELVQNIADTEHTTGEPIADIDEAAAERVRKNEEQIARNEALAKELEITQEEHEKRTKHFNDNVN